MMFNSTDLKNSNNTLYEHKRAIASSGGMSSATSARRSATPIRLSPRKNHPDASSGSRSSSGSTTATSSSPTTAVQEPRARPHHAGGRGLGEQPARPATDRQWKTRSVRAGRTRTADRFIRKLRDKIAEGRALERRTASAMPSS